MTPVELHATIKRLGLSQAHTAALVGVSTHTVERWLAGKRAIPEGVARLLRLYVGLLDKGANPVEIAAMMDGRKGA